MQFGQALEAVEIGQGDVEHDDVRPYLRHQCDRLLQAGRLANDLQVRARAHDLLDSFADQFMVVRDD
jgi:hypothetical protein